ncbi:hypothetical protein OF122_13090 [Pelagibacterium flavum]|uniref:Uncharacterized protein n=1 Tax=Pelagibacterium flavum TaxID=2984530 RepID=A0ABY6IKV9_9HYPH|nr:hypothetical protein [Pelagibacterium sp. YIM 151497]UYQ70994.1 hypothetical protein OF122_13090 [Pelagibacterium sp. YIM 151497]
MNRPPKDITEAAERVYNKLGRGSNDDILAIAKALADERERCAVIADDMRDQDGMDAAPCIFIAAQIRAGYGPL